MLIRNFDALDACYVALWQLLRPDSHRLADDSLAAHTNRFLAHAIETMGIAPATQLVLFPKSF